VIASHVGGRGCAVRPPPEDPLELDPDDPEDPDEPDDPDDPVDPEPPVREDVDDDPPLVLVPLDEPDVYPTPLMTFPCGVSLPRITTIGAP
jgi:hypothetical protein